MGYMLSRKILTADQLVAIGSAAVESTFIEELIHKMIVVMSGVTEKKLMPFMGHLMMEGRLAILENLAEIYLKSKKKQAKLNTIIENIRRANTGRISLIHGVWEVNDILLVLAGNKPTGDARAKSMKKPDAAKVSAKKAETIAQEISDAYGELQDFWLNNFLKPAARKRQARLQARSAALLQNQ